MSFSLNSSRLLSRVFRKVESLVWDLTTGNVGIRRQDGIYTANIDTAAKTANISVNPFDSFATPVPAYALNTPIADTKPGDIVLSSAQGVETVLGWVVEVREKSLALVSPDGFAKDYTPPKVAVMNAEGGLLVVKNLLSLTGGSSDGLAGIQQFMMLQSLKSDGDTSDLLPLLLMTQGGAGLGAGGAGGINPLMLMALSGKKGGKAGGIDPMMLMLMSGGLGGAGGAPAAGGTAAPGAMNPLMLMALAGGDTDTDDLIMMSMLSGGATSNPMQAMLLASAMKKSSEPTPLPLRTIRPTPRPL